MRDLVATTVEVSVVVVTWNSSSYILDCLDSIYRFSLQNTFEIIVVDNASIDGTSEIIRNHYPDVKVLDTGRNLGFPRAVNLALKIVQGYYVFLLNPDTRFESDVLRELTAFCKSCPDAGAVSPLIIEIDGSINLSTVRDLPRLQNIIFTQFGLRKAFPNSKIFAREFRGDSDRRTVVRTSCLTGAALMIPKSLLEAVGPLDERMPMYFEDLDICARIGRKGANLYHVPSAALVHLGGGSAEAFLGKLILLAAEKGHAPWLFLRTYEGNVSAWIFTAIILVSNALRTIVFSCALALAKPTNACLTKRLKAGRLVSLVLVKWSLANKNGFQKKLNALFGDFPRQASGGIGNESKCNHT